MNCDDAENFGITAKTTDDELAKIVEKYEDGDDEVAFVPGSFEDWAKRERESAIEESEDGDEE